MPVRMKISCWYLRILYTVNYPLDPGLSHYDRGLRLT